MTESLNAEDRARIRARYPRRSPTDLVVGIGAAVAMAAAVVLVLLSGLTRANPPVVAMVRAFETGPQSTHVELVVQRSDPARAATCFVYAQAPNYERVGELVVDVAPGTKELTVVEVTLQTLRKATSVSVENCSLVD